MLKTVLFLFLFIVKKQPSTAIAKLKFFTTTGRISDQLFHNCFEKSYRKNSKSTKQCPFLCNLLPATILGILLHLLKIFSHNCVFERKKKFRFQSRATFHCIQHFASCGLPYSTTSIFWGQCGGSLHLLYRPAIHSIQHSFSCFAIQ